MPKEDKQSDNTPQPSHIPGLAPIYVVIFGFVFVCVGIIMLATGGTKNITFKPETPREAYLRILGETHTGLRLARLNDFADNYKPNADTLRARAGRDILTAHEQREWAKLSQTLYNLRSTDKQNADALATYKSTWGIWNRQSDLPTLLQATGVVIISSADTQYAPNARPSRFAKGNKETILAGEIPIGVKSDGVTAEDGTVQVYTNQFAVQKARIRYAKRPKYPRRARRKSIEAVVTLSLFIDERGNVARTELFSVNAKKYRKSFARASKKAAMVSKFYPKTIGGKPVATSNYLRQYTFVVE